MEQLAQQIERTITELYGIEATVRLERPDLQFGDYATNIALQIAGRLGKSPREIAEQLGAALAQAGTCNEVTIAGPGFINLRVSARQLYDSLASQWSAQYGSSKDGEGRLAVVEFPSPNVAKPYSVGHLRPGNQGWAAKRLLEVTGWRVITDNHIGDAGAPFGIWVVGFQRFSSDEALERDGVYELGRMYIQTKNALKEEAEQGGRAMADEVQEWLLRLERDDPEARQYSNRFKTISMQHIHAVMERLELSTDYEYGESFFVPKGKAAVEQLIASGVATQNSDGSVIVPLEDAGFEVPLLVQKSNGAALYATTDLATILFRENEWHPDKVVYCVGAEQQFYFSQLFAMAKKLGITTDLYHLWFGVIDQMGDDGVRQKMSSRKGVVLMEELLDVAEQKAREVTADREVGADDIKKIALGAVKYTDFVADRRTNILFDWHTIFALSGKSGPYVQYAAVRVNKLLRDNPERTPMGVYDYEPEKAIVAQLLDYPQVVRIAAEQLEPHRVAAYLYNLAREMNRYYEQTPIATQEVGEAEKSARLDLLEKVSHVFAHGLGILGISVPERM
ncbi:arginine--tRNA ligase [Candidatus Saccharibacteria bacterium]|nr:MAG: arginine--tRNA ligase [Candidatus Saccharibacteria bacterium]